MDWSLVLASQGIEHAIQHSEETGWALAVSEADYERAITHIRLYRLENHHWWHRTILQPGVVFDWRSTVWLFLIISFYWWSELRPDLRSLGMWDGVALAHGEWWRLFTATWLHADPAHLALNAVFGLVLLGLAMGLYGSATGLLAAYLAGVGGNLTAWLTYDASQRGLGSSGVVMGALGLLTVHSFSQLRRKNPKRFRRPSSGIFGGVLLFVMIGVSSQADVVAHAGGFVSGILIGLLLALLSSLAQRRWVNLAAGFLFAGLVILPWLCALTRTKSTF
jgi:membrane associated rhomboid family serine protease